MVCVRTFEKFNHLCLLSVIPRLLSGFHRQAADADHVLCYRRPGCPQASAVRQLEERVERVHREPVCVQRAAVRAGRIVASRPGTILCLPRPCRQPVLRDVRGAGLMSKTIQYTYGVIGARPSSTTTANDFGCCESAPDQYSGGLSPAPAHVYCGGQPDIGAEFRARHRHRLRRDRPRPAQPAQQSAAAEAGNGRSPGWRASPARAAHAPAQCRLALATGQGRPRHQDSGPSGSSLPCGSHASPSDLTRAS